MGTHVGGWMHYQRVESDQGEAAQSVSDVWVPAATKSINKPASLLCFIHHVHDERNSQKVMDQSQMRSVVDCIDRQTCKKQVSCTGGELFTLKPTKRVLFENPQWAFSILPSIFLFGICRKRFLNAVPLNKLYSVGSSICLTQYWRYCLPERSYIWIRPWPSLLTFWPIKAALFPNNKGAHRSLMERDSQ